MPDSRSRFHQEIGDLERSIHGVADRTERMVGIAVDALVSTDDAMATAVWSARHLARPLA